MSRPLILITPHTEKESTELSDAGISLSNCYTEAVARAGGVPLVLPCASEPGALKEALSRADGILMSGGEDVSPKLYSNDLPPEVRATIVPAKGERDLFELAVVDEVFRQSKPLLAICRGLQIINVALGGDLIADIPLQRPSAMGHNRQAERFEPVHEVELEPGSFFASVIGESRLRVNSTHHQAVGRVAPPLRATGRSSDGIIEALELGAGHESALPFFLGVQFHPERLYDRYPEHHRIFAAFVASCRKAG